MNELLVRKLRTSQAMFAGALGLTAVTGNAQTAPTNDQEVKLDKFVVTGSYIPTTGTAAEATISPVVRIDRRVIEQSGFTNTAELLQRINVSNGGAIPISNNATGFTAAASSTSLRGLGPEATLVLINGRRVAPYPIGAGGTTAFVDLNSIPLAAVENIEVLKDGASALYGADAVAGVVNIILRKGIDGTEAAVTYGNTTNKDSSETIASIVSGAQTENANVLVGFSYYNREAIFNRDRDYSAIGFRSTNSSPANLEVTPAAVLEAGGTVPASVPADARFLYATSGTGANNNGLLPASAYTYQASAAGYPSRYNTNAASGAYPERKVVGSFASAERNILGTENIKAFVDGSYTNVRTENQLAPGATGNFSGSGTELVIPARTASPLPLADGRARAAVAGAFNRFNPFNQDLTSRTRLRLAEFGNRVYDDETDAFRVATGIRGENIMEKWNFEAAFSYSEIQADSREQQVSSSRFNRLLNEADPIYNPSSSEYIGTTVPYNPFGFFGNPIANNSQVVDFAKVVVKNSNESKLTGFNFVASTNELFSVPAGEVGLAFGGDYRQERLNQYPDAYSGTGDVIGSSPAATTQGQRKIAGVFVETAVPILRNVPGAYTLDTNVAVRHEEFLTSDRKATVPKFGLKWQPLDDTLSIRTTWSRSFREPSLYELYSTPTSLLAPVTNPVSGASESEQDVTIAGNRRLAAEKSRTLNLGVVWSPKGVLAGFSASIDYFKIIRKGTVEGDYQDLVNRFFGRDLRGNVVPGGLRPGESVDLFTDGSIRTVNALFQNVGRTEVDGLDLGAEYALNTDTAGRFVLAASATWTRSYQKTVLPGGPLLELIGNDAGVDNPADIGTADDAYLKWKGRTTLDWSLGGWSAVLGATYTDGFNYIDPGTEEGARAASTIIWDAQVGFNFRDQFGPWLRDTKATVGVRNLFDKDPPYVAGSAVGFNSANYPTFLYNSEGQFVYVSLERKF